MKRMFKGLWYMIWDIVGAVLMVTMMMPIYMLDVVSTELVTDANIVMWDICKESIKSIIKDIAVTTIVVIIEIVAHIVLIPINIVICAIGSAQNASRYASGKDRKYVYTWRYAWNLLQRWNLNIKNNKQNREYSGFSFKSYSDK